MRSLRRRDCRSGIDLHGPGSSTPEVCYLLSIHRAEAILIIEQMFGTFSSINHALKYSSAGCHNEYKIINSQRFSESHRQRTAKITKMNFTRKGEFEKFVVSLVDAAYSPKKKTIQIL
jgi:hypothetical protein